MRFLRSMLTKMLNFCRKWQLDQLSSTVSSPSLETISNASARAFSGALAAMALDREEDHGAAAAHLRQRLVPSARFSRCRKALTGLPDQAATPKVKFADEDLVYDQYWDLVSSSVMCRAL